MTELEMTKEKNRLRDFNCNHYRGTDAQKLRCYELDCIDMINSVLAYQCRNYRNGTDVLEAEENSHYSSLAQYVQKLGRERVINFIDEQIKDIKEVECGVFTDSEGCTYNSIQWAR